MARIPHIEIILPIYNEVKNIQPLIKLMDTTLTQLKGKATASYLFINDGSNDGSKELLGRLFAERNDIRVVDLLHNFGHSAALACGVDHFSGDIALIMDADMQDPPDALPEMFEEWKKGAKTVVAERGKRKEKNSIMFRTFYFLLHKTAKTLPPVNFGTHSLIDKSVIRRLRELKERNRYFPGLVGFTSPKITPVKVDRGARAEGKSRVGFVGLVNLAITAFLSFSSTPVRLVSIFGLIISAGAVVFGGAIVGIKLFSDKAIPGWASTMSLIAFSSGVQLLCLGIIGEYIARIYDEVKQRPLYLVESIQEKSSKIKELAA